MNFFYTLLFSFISCFGFAEGMHISGIITDTESQKKIEGAFVLIHFYNGFEFSDITDSTGRYDIYTSAVVPEDYYTIQIDAKNYYQLNGFVHVTKNCVFNFNLKSKNQTQQVVSIPIIDAVKPTLPMPALEGFATNNLVFLIDASSSMNMQEKMPLLKTAMKYLVNELRTTDKISILTFSSSVKEILPATTLNDKQNILSLIDNISFGSSSQGGLALQKAYKTAQDNYIKKGNNRIILATDGLFTSGEKDYKKMQQLIETGLDKNISLSIFCFGKNTEYVNTKLSKLANIGNGNFATITDAENGKHYMLEEAKAVKVEK